MSLWSFIGRRAARIALAYREEIDAQYLIADAAEPRFPADWPDTPIECQRPPEARDPGDDVHPSSTEPDSTATDGERTGTDAANGGGSHEVADHAQRSEGKAEAGEGDALPADPASVPFALLRVGELQQEVRQWQEQAGQAAVRAEQLEDALKKTTLEFPADVQPLLDRMVKDTGRTATDLIVSIVSAVLRDDAVAEAEDNTDDLNALICEIPPEETPEPGDHRQRAAQIIELAQKGVRPKLISEQMGLSYKTVSKVLENARKKGVELPSFSRTGQQTDDIEKRDEAIVNMAVSGLSPAKIAPQIGMSPAYVSVILQKARKRGTLVPFFTTSGVVQKPPGDAVTNPKMETGT